MAISLFMKRILRKHYEIFTILSDKAWSFIDWTLLMMKKILKLLNDKLDHFRSGAKSHIFKRDCQGSININMSETDTDRQSNIWYSKQKEAIQTFMRWRS